MRLLMRFILAAITTWCIPLYAGYFPPSLNIQGFGENGTILLSALVMAKEDVEVPALTIKGVAQTPTPISSLFIPGWISYRYLFNISQTGATFDFGSKHFNIPSFEGGLKCFYTSCADAQPGTSENWKKFYAFANKSGANVHLKGGDNIPYPDTGLDEIFPDGWPDREITQEEQNKIIDLYLKLYLQALAELPKEGTIIPAIVQRDDHDCYDGRGSLGDSEKRLIPTYIRSVADFLFLLLQQHIQPSEKESSGFFGGQDNDSKIYQFSSGETILQVDGRGERTRKQICSTETWDQIWKKLDGMGTCKILYVMLGVPIIFPDMPEAAQLVELIQKHPLAAEFTEKFLGKNRDGSPEPLDDVYFDHWCAHKPERDRLIQKLQEFSRRTGAKVVLMSGDVHSASTGTITADGKPTIYQVTSSGVGSTGPSRAGIAALDMLQHLVTQTTSNGDTFGLQKTLTGPDGIQPTIVNERNCCVIAGNTLTFHTETDTTYTSNLLTLPKTKQNKCCALA